MYEQRPEHDKARVCLAERGVSDTETRRAPARGGGARTCGEKTSSAPGLCSYARIGRIRRFTPCGRTRARRVTRAAPGGALRVRGVRGDVGGSQVQGGGSGVGRGGVGVEVFR